MGTKSLNTYDDYQYTRIENDENGKWMLYYKDGKITAIKRLR